MRLTESDLRGSLNGYGIPEHMHDGTIGYVMHGIPPGDFLYAVITNNLKEAVAYGDEQNLSALVNWVRFFYNATPSQCWGSEEKMNEWMEHRRELKESQR